MVFEVRDFGSKQRRPGPGVTLIEMLIVLAIIGLLVSLVIGVGSHVQHRSNEHLTRETIAIVVAALKEFHDYGYVYKFGEHLELGLTFPLDCNDQGPGGDILLGTLESEFNLTPGTASIEPVTPGDPIDHRPEYSGIEGLYFFLSRVPESRKTLDKISDSLITSRDANGYMMKITLGPLGEYPLFRIIDRWGEPLYYDYYDETETDRRTKKKTRRTFPVVTSAGPDKRLGTTDDIICMDM